MDIDGVFGKSKVWWDCLPPEAKAELDRLAAAVKARGHEPSWPIVLAEFRNEFPDAIPCTVQTIMSTVRRRVDAL